MTRRQVQAAAQTAAQKLKQRRTILVLLVSIVVVELLFVGLIFAQQDLERSVAKLSESAGVGNLPPSAVPRYVTLMGLFPVFLVALTFVIGFISELRRARPHP